jgi:hypothetical protein
MMRSPVQPKVHRKAEREREVRVRETKAIDSRGLFAGDLLSPVSHHFVSMSQIVGNHSQ